MKSYKNIAIFMCFYILFSCKITQDEQLLMIATKIAENFQDTSAISVSHQQIQDNDNDNDNDHYQGNTNKLKNLLKQAILETLISGELSENIESEEFKTGFIKSWKLFSKENRRVFEEKKDRFALSDDEFKSICIKVIQLGEKNGFFS